MRDIYLLLPMVSTFINEEPAQSVVHKRLHKHLSNICDAKVNIKRVSTIVQEMVESGLLYRVQYKDKLFLAHRDDVTVRRACGIHDD